MSSGDEKDISGLLFCRCRGMLLEENLTGNKFIDAQGNEYLERKNYEQIWIHQYLKVKVLRHLFNSFPDKIPIAKAMDSLKNQVEKPNSHKLYVTLDNLAAFGESTSRGVITRNCFKSMNANNISIPSWVSGPTPHEKIMDSQLRRNFGRIINMLTRRFT